MLSTKKIQNEVCSNLQNSGMLLTSLNFEYRGYTNTLLVSSKGEGDLVHSHGKDYLSEVAEHVEYIYSYCFNPIIKHFKTKYANPITNLSFGVNPDGSISNEITLSVKYLCDKKRTADIYVLTYVMHNLKSIMPFSKYCNHITFDVQRGSLTKVIVDITINLKDLHKVLKREVNQLEYNQWVSFLPSLKSKMDNGSYVALEVPIVNGLLKADHLKEEHTLCFKDNGK